MALIAGKDELKDARALLAAKHVRFTKVIRAEADGILYLDGDGHAMTGWVSQVKGKTVLELQPGFAAEHGDYLDEAT